MTTHFGAFVVSDWIPVGGHASSDGLHDKCGHVTSDEDDGRFAGVTTWSEGKIDRSVAFIVNIDVSNGNLNSSKGYIWTPKSARSGYSHQQMLVHS